MQHTDVVVIGGGIIGLATAYRLVERYPGKRVVLLEKEPSLAVHQTGHNSGVLHSGIYYKPGSLKAINCREGRRAMEAFCATEHIPYERCGKVIVASHASELPVLEEIFQRGQANQVRCELVGIDRMNELEPHVAGVGAIHVPDAGIVDFAAVCERLAKRVQQQGGQIITSGLVRAITRHPDHLTVHSQAGEFRAPYAVNCCGLHCDRMTRMAGQTPAARIIPFRGEYYELTPEARHLCRNLIYPVPDPRFPFLGVHFTRTIDGHIECGPNAVLALAREGYRKFDINLRDLAGSLTYPGFLRLAARYWRVGAGEVWRSLSKRAFVRALQQLVPDVRPEHLQSAPAGVRAQAVGRDGTLVDDFVLQESDRIVNVGNAPSPAATASLNIGSLIVDKLAARFD